MKRFILDTGIAALHLDRRDCLVSGNATVVTMDSDLAAIPGLTVENWADPM
jgi:hypothetical protein